MSMTFKELNINNGKYLTHLLVVKDENGKMLLQIGAAPEYKFEWGEDVDPGEAGERFAEGVRNWFKSNL